MSCQEAVVGARASEPLYRSFVWCPQICVIFAGYAHLFERYLYITCITLVHACMFMYIIYIYIFIHYLFILFIYLFYLFIYLLIYVYIYVCVCA